MRHGRLADAHERRDITHAELSRRERIEDAYARRIAEDAKGVGQRFDRARRQQRAPANGRIADVEVRRRARFARRDSGSGLGRMKIGQSHVVNTCIYEQVLIYRLTYWRCWVKRGPPAP
jgi:hypothetical protein